jgi:hypothetical protein
MEIYIVTQGEYSDYHIVGVFTDKEKAEELCDFGNEIDSWADTRIETYESDTIDVKGRELFFVRMQPDGKVLEVAKAGSIYDIEDNRVGQDMNGNFYTACLARDKKHAIKIMAERKLRYKIENNI